MQSQCRSLCSNSSSSYPGRAVQCFLKSTTNSNSYNHGCRSLFRVDSCLKASLRGHHSHSNSSGCQSRYLCHDYYNSAGNKSFPLLSRRDLHHYHQQSSVQLLSTSFRNLGEKTSSTTSSIDVSSPEGASGGVKPQHSYRPTNWDKWALVYTNTYPNREAIPDVVPTSKIAISKDKLRTKAAIFLAVFTFLMCVVVSYFGSRARRAGTGTRINQYAREQFIGEEAAGKTK